MTERRGQEWFGRRVPPGPGRLRCAGCGDESDEFARRWCAYRVDADLEADEAADVLTFCQDCAELEFG
jgi:hypothetical protein